jgi:carbonic anhydrase
MQLIEAIIDANHRAVAGDSTASLSPSDHARSLPLIVLTCIDPRLNPFFPGVLGLRSEDFIWLRNAGNIITDPLSSTMRSLSLACAVKRGKEIAIIGHSDCQICKTSVMQLMEYYKDLGIDRKALPINLVEYFGLFASERQNVMKGVDITRTSPLIGPKIPIHGILLDISTGKLESVIDGYKFSRNNFISEAEKPKLLESEEQVPKTVPSKKEETLKVNKEFQKKWKSNFKAR